MKQLLLEIAPPAQPTFANFVPGANRELLHRLRSAAAGNSGERVIYLWGDSGSGKRHLLEALAHAGVRPVVRARPDAIPGEARDSIVTLAHVDTLDPQQQVCLFNLINILDHAVLVAAGPCAPAQLGVREDLATRLGSGLVYQVHALTDADKREALAAHAQARGFALSEEIAAYLLRHARRDMPSLIAILDAIDRHSLETGRPVTLPLLKEALNALPETTREARTV